MTHYPMTHSLRMFWPDGRRASAHCSFVHAFRQWAEVLGRSGSLTLDDFVLPKNAHQVNSMRRTTFMSAAISMPRHHCRPCAQQPRSLLLQAAFSVVSHPGLVSM
jgi:hypothetical protein